MAREIMERRAADNPYLHKDFHSALNHGMVYLHRHFGEAAVRDWLRDFARQWYSPLRQRLAAGDLGALREHVEAVYRRTGADLDPELVRSLLDVHRGAHRADSGRAPDRGQRLSGGGSYAFAG